MKRLKTWAAAAAAAMLALAGTAQASPMTLVDGGLGVLDGDTQLEWTANMNLNGRMTWAAANAWIATLNASHYAGHNDWRLPTLDISDTSCSAGTGDVRTGYNCSGGELSHLFVTNLGNKAYQSALTQTGDTAEQIANLALFSNLQSHYYWSGTEYAPDLNVTWYFRPQDGYQLYNAKSNELHGVAVRAFDVVAAVPEPQTLALVMLALGAAGLARRRRPALHPVGSA
jgi:hypothetical protein